ncbi:MAG TPA: glucoamylase family protein [Edaphocola sp.]|nr:glucoamylase family protein [Edaphocola sp.]
MCCVRCISEVKRIFESAGLYSLKLKLGEVVVNSSITKAVHNKVVKDLEANGFSIVSSIDDQIIVNIQALLIFYLNEYQIENVSLFTISAFLTKQLDKSYSQLSRIFKKGTNNTIEKYFIQLKIEKAKELLILNQIDIAGIGYLLGYEYLYAGPLFIHQLSHIWIDFRSIQDAFMRTKGIDYFENSRRATCVQRQYAINNPLKFDGYASCCWGITASEGPGPEILKINGIERHFFDYLARGVPYGPDDGTVAPWAMVASMPFEPEIVLEALNYCIHQAKLTEFNSYGFKASFNPTHPGEAGNPYGWWVSPWHFGLNQGPIVLMIENYRSGLLWKWMRACPYIVAGLRKADFTGGWL